MSSDLLLAYLNTNDLLNFKFLLFYMEVLRYNFQNFKILEIVNFLTGIQHTVTLLLCLFV